MATNNELGMRVKENSQLTIMPLHGGQLQLTFKGFPALTFTPGLDSLLNRKRAEYSGFKQAWENRGLQDNKAPRTLEERYASLKAWRDHHEDGSDLWVVPATGDRGVDTGIVILAMIRVGKARDVETAEVLIQRSMVKTGLDRTEFLKALSKAGDIAPTIRAIRDERAAAANPLNSDVLLAGLDEAEGEVEESDE